MTTTSPLLLSDLDYHLPPDLIAQQPIEPRDHCRLLAADRSTSTIAHKRFYDCVEYFQAGDVLVVNNSKVIPARLFGTKPTGGKTEIFLLRQIDKLNWECLVSGKRLPEGLIISLRNNVQATLVTRLTYNTWQVKFSTPDILSIGTVPLPPYITSSSDMRDYQTVYAKAEGSVAAPTAGLHFTPELLKRLQAKGVVIKEITLHVGLGTFAPIKVDTIAEHVMHAEFAILPPDTAAAIVAAKQQGHTITAVGTTVARTLEAFTGQAQSGWVDIFITPGYTFKVVDRLITNFHLPKTTLLLLVAALMGKEFMDEAYRVAIVERYRFYSFGDAMMIV